MEMDQLPSIIFFLSNDKILSKCCSAVLHDYTGTKGAPGFYCTCCDGLVAIINPQNQNILFWLEDKLPSWIQTQINKQVQPNQPTSTITLPFWSSSASYSSYAPSSSATTWSSRQRQSMLDKLKKHFPSIAVTLG